MINVVVGCHIGASILVLEHNQGLLETLVDVLPVQSAIEAVAARH